MATFTEAAEEMTKNYDTEGFPMVSLQKHL